MTRYIIISLIISCLSWGCVNTSSMPQNSIDDLAKCDSEVLIKNWEFTKPIKSDPVSTWNISNELGHFDQADRISRYKDFTELYPATSSDTAITSFTPFARFSYHADNSYVAVDSLFKIKAPSQNYVVCTVISSIDQDVAVMASCDYGMRLWVNQNLQMESVKALSFNGYEYLLKVHLKKGENLFLAKLLNQSGSWRFLVKLSSLNYAKSNSIGINYESFCNRYLLKEGDTLSVKVPSVYMETDQISKVEIRDIHEELVWMIPFANKRSIALPMKSIPEGPYQIRLFAGKDTLTQNIFYGDYHKFILAAITALPAVGTEKVKRNLQVLLNRLSYTDTVKVNHDDFYERKLSGNLFEMANIYDKYLQKKEAISGVPGLHIRVPGTSFYKVDSYMIYVPSSYLPNRAIPLVVMMPHQTTIRPFEISMYVADVDRVEFVKKLAERYGYAVVWSSARCYEDHSFSNMTPNAILNILSDVKADYNIDSNRVYSYGDCLGGAMALFMANKYPSLFAAVGIDAPALTEFDISHLDKDGKTSPFSRKSISENFYADLDNYKYSPVFIVHSKYETKNRFGKSKDLTTAINNNGGNAHLKVLYLEKKKQEYPLLNLIPENNNVARIFQFFLQKEKVVPDTIKFSTWQLKFNRAFWLTIDDINPGKKAKIEAIVDRKNNAINIKTFNVNRYTIDPSILKTLDKRRFFRLINNGKLSYNNRVPSNLYVEQYSGSLHAANKSHLVEGPLNDVFSSRFVIVRGTKGSPQDRMKYDTAIKIFTANWKSKFLSECPVVNDTEITDQLIKENSLVIINSESTNYVLSRIKSKLPYNIFKSHIKVGNVKIDGFKLSLKLVYPNPLCKNRYVLILDSGAEFFSREFLENIFQNGWTDYEVWNQYAQLRLGDFNRYWQ